MRFFQKKIKIKKIFIKKQSGKIDNFFFSLIEFFSIFFWKNQKNGIIKKKAIEFFIKNEKIILFSNSFFKKYLNPFLTLYPDKFFVIFRGNQKITFIDSMAEENIEETRKKIFQKFNLQRTKKKNLFKKETILVIISNQTCFFQIIFILFMMSNSFKEKITINPNRFWKEDLLLIRFGKMIKPADFRKNFSDGHEDFIRISCSFHKKKIIIGNKLENEFLFISPLFLRLLNLIDLERIRSLSSIVYVDCFHLILSQNWENLNFILKNIFWNRINSKKKKNKKFTENKNFFIFSKFISKKLTFIGKFENLLIARKEKYLKSRNQKTENLIMVYKFKNNIFDLKNRFKLLQENFFTNFINKKPKTILIFCRDYFHFIFVRNRLWKKFRNKNKRLLLFHEFLKPSEIFRKKELLCVSEPKVILMTERFYFYYRYHFSRVEIVFFFSNPLDGEFYYEISRYVKKYGEKYIFTFIPIDEAQHYIKN